VIIKLNDKSDGIRFTFVLSHKDSDGVASGNEFEDSMHIKITDANIFLHAFYNHNPAYFHITKPIQPNAFTRKMEGTLNDIFNLLKLMYSDPQLFELPQGSNGSPSNAQQVLGVARFPANREDGSVAGGAAEKDNDDSTRDRALSSASTAASGGRSPPLTANGGASEPMQLFELPQGSNGSASNNVTDPLSKPPAFSNGSASSDAIVNPLFKP
jgi:hypothetical protein